WSAAAAPDMRSSGLGCPHPRPGLSPLSSTRLAPMAINERLVEQERAAGYRGPAVERLRALPALDPHRPAELRLGEERVGGSRQGPGEAWWVTWLDRSRVLDQLDGDEPPGLAVNHYLRDAPYGAGDHGHLACHRLQVDQAERFVYRRAAEHGRVGIKLDGRG